MQMGGQADMQPVGAQAHRPGIARSPTSQGEAGERGQAYWLSWTPKVSVKVPPGPMVAAVPQVTPVVPATWPRLIAPVVLLPTHWLGGWIGAHTV